MNAMNALYRSAEQPLEEMRSAFNVNRATPTATPHGISGDTGVATTRPLTNLPRGHFAIRGFQMRGCFSRMSAHV